MEPEPPRPIPAPDRRATRLAWPAAAAVIGLLALLAWAVVGGVIWLALR